MQGPAGMGAVPLSAFLCHAMVSTWGHCRDATCPEELQGPASPFYSCPGVSMLLSALYRRQPRKLNTGLDERVTLQTNLAVSFTEKAPKSLVATEIPRNFHLFLSEANCQQGYGREMVGLKVEDTSKAEYFKERFLLLCSDPVLALSPVLKKDFLPLSNTFRASLLVSPPKEAFVSCKILSLFKG